MNLADLERKTKAHLEGAYVADEDLIEAINSARREVWREVGGPVADTVFMDLVEGVRDYALDFERVSAIVSVSIRQGTLDRDVPSKLRPTTPRQILAQEASFPNTVSPRGVPIAWAIRPIVLSAVGDGAPLDRPAGEVGVGGDARHEDVPAGAL